MKNYRSGFTWKQSFKYSKQVMKQKFELKYLEYIHSVLHTEYEAHIQYLVHFSLDAITVAICLGILS